MLVDPATQVRFPAGTGWNYFAPKIWISILDCGTHSKAQCCVLFVCLNIGITHVFSCINICRVPRMLFEHEADRPSVQHHPRDPASVNAMKQTCVIVILAYFTLFQLNSH